MQLAAYISKFAANLSGSFGYVVTSKQWNSGCRINGPVEEIWQKNIQLRKNS